MNNIPTKSDLETRLASLRQEIACATAGGKDRIGSAIRLHETALLELRAYEAESASRQQVVESERRKDEARQHLRTAAGQGANIAAHLAALLASIDVYKSEMADAVMAWPQLKSRSVNTLLSDRELLKAIATELLQAGIRLPQGGFNSDARPLADKIRLTERALLGAIDGFSALYQVAAELEPVR